MKLQIKYSRTKLIEVEIDPSASIIALMQEVYKHDENVQTDLISLQAYAASMLLLFQNQWLEEGKSLSDYTIQPNQIIDLISLRFKKEEIGPNQQHIPDEFICQLTGSVFNLPMLLPCGVSVEKQYIDEWLSEEEKCPFTNIYLSSDKLIENQPLKDKLVRFTQKYPILRDVVAESRYQNQVLTRQPPISWPIEPDENDRLAMGLNNRFTSVQASEFSPHGELTTGFAWIRRHTYILNDVEFSWPDIRATFPLHPRNNSPIETDQSGLTLVGLTFVSPQSRVMNALFTELLTLVFTAGTTLISRRHQQVIDINFLFALLICRMMAMNNVTNPQEPHQNRFSALLQSEGIFSSSRTQLSINSYTVLSNEFLQAWRPPLTHALGGFHNAHHRALRYLMNEENLTPVQALHEINELNWLQAKTLKTLYSYGLRGEHLRDIENHIQMMYPDFDFFNEAYDALERLVLEQRMGIDDAIEEVKQLNLTQLRQFTID